MAWFLLLLAGCFEIGFAVFLKLSNGFTHLWATLAFAVCAIISFLLLNISLKWLPVGTAYAVWTGIGAAGAATVGILAFKDPASVVRIISIVAIIGGVVGLNLAEAR